MKHFLVSTLFLLISVSALATANIGEKAPAFKVKDAHGKVHKLSDYKGDHLVLEWYNKDCPYVRKHYDTGNMQKIQEKLKEHNVKWLTVISSAPGKQGHQSAEDTLSTAKKENSNATAILRDESGKMGQAYGATRTPHMFLIDDEGILRYKGAIDDNPSSNPETVKTANNYLAPAVKSVLKGKEVEEKVTEAYGCSVKY